MGIEEYAGRGPTFLPEHYLVGELAGWGIIESPFGSLQKRYTIRARGAWDEARQIVDFTETWTFDDGMVETLAWLIRKDGSNHYRGTEAKVQGEAVGEAAGFAYHWTYTRETPQKNGEPVVLNFDDWFYLIDDRVCLVRGTAGRLGLPFAIAHVTYQKRD
jgi:hypothetical protein